MSSIAVILFCTTGIHAQDKWADYLIEYVGWYELVEECGDIAIKGKDYTILTRTLYDWQGEEVKSTKVMGYKRETTDSVLFIMAPDNPDSLESLLYVYHVEVGDTLSLDIIYYGNFKFVVEEIDTIVLLEKERRRVRLKHATFGYDDIWVEGIGSIVNGYLWRGIWRTVGEAGSQFSCYYSWEQDAIYAPYDSLACLMEMLDSSACETLTSRTVPIKATTVTLYPNPFSWKMHIAGIPFPCNLAVYDITGKAVIQSTVVSDEITINTAHFANGIYYIVLIPDRANPITIKAIKL